MVKKIKRRTSGSVNAYLTIVLVYIIKLFYTHIYVWLRAGADNSSSTKFDVCFKTIITCK